MPLEDLVWLVSMSGVPISDLTLLIAWRGQVSVRTYVTYRNIYIRKCMWRTYVTYASVTLGMASWVASDVIMRVGAATARATCGHGFHCSSTHDICHKIGFFKSGGATVQPTRMRKQSRSGDGVSKLLKNCLCQRKLAINLQHIHAPGGFKHHAICFEGVTFTTCGKPRQAVYWSPEKRRKSRPRQSWEWNVTVDLREVGLTWENFSKMTISCAWYGSCVVQCASSACGRTTVYGKMFSCSCVGMV